MNDVYLTGTLERKFPMRTITMKKGGESYVVKFTLKCPNGKSSEYITCEAWGGTAKTVDAANNGAILFARGSIRNNSYEGKNGKVFEQLVSVRNVGELNISAVPASKPEPVKQPEPEPVQEYDSNDVDEYENIPF